jgi:methionine-S-sulfoxide reductase
MDTLIPYSTKNNQAVFAAGCFWGVQYYFDQVPGVKNTIVGYSGGHVKNPTTEQIYDHTTGHAEAVLIDYDQVKVSYETLVRHFFRIHDPTQFNRQGPNVGDNYRSAIFYLNDEQKAVAEAIKQEVQANYKQPIVTQIMAAQPFYRADEFHQKFTEKTGGWGMCHVGYQPI